MEAVSNIFSGSVRLGICLPEEVCCWVYLFLCIKRKSTIKGLFESPIRNLLTEIVSDANEILSKIYAEQVVAYR